MELDSNFGIWIVFNNVLTEKQENVVYYNYDAASLTFILFYFKRKEK